MRVDITVVDSKTTDILLRGVEDSVILLSVIRFVHNTPVTPIIPRFANIERESSARFDLAVQNVDEHISVLLTRHACPKYRCHVWVVVPFGN